MMTWLRENWRLYHIRRNTIRDQCNRECCKLLGYLIWILRVFLLLRSCGSFYITPFAVHYDKIRNHLRETVTNSAKMHSLARKYNHLRINQIQLRFLHFNQHSITIFGIYMRHWANKREKYTFINANIKVINTILKVNRDNWHFYDTVCNSIAFLDNLRKDKTNINKLVQSIECSLHLIYKNWFSIKQ